jgi:hypothetical protein
MANFNWKQAGAVKRCRTSESGMDVNRSQDNNQKIERKAKSIDFTHSTGATSLVKSTNDKEILTR